MPASFSVARQSAAMTGGGILLRDAMLSLVRKNRSLSSSSCAILLTAVKCPDLVNWEIYPLM